MKDPKQQLAAARARLKRLRSEKRAPDVLARYEREVQRLEAWVKVGAPLSPAFVSFGALDPLTQRTLIADLVSDTKNQPDPSTAVEITTDDAVVALKWPGFDAGISMRGRSVVLEQLVQRLKRELVSPRGEMKVRLMHALTELADEGHWTLERAKHYVILKALAAAIVQAKEEWSGRIGPSREGNADVTGVPAAAGAVGYVKWLQQEVPKYARQELLGDLQPDEEVDLPLTPTGGLVVLPSDDIGEEAPGEDDAPDSKLLEIARAVLTFNERELLVFLADTSPELAERLCKLADLALSEKQRVILNTDCDTAREISAATGIPSTQVPVYGEGYAKKLAKMKVTPGKLTRKQWKTF